MSYQYPLNPKKYLPHMAAKLARRKEIGEAETFAEVREGWDVACVFLGLGQEPESPYDVYIVQSDDTYYDLGELYIVERDTDLCCVVGGLGDLPDGTIGIADLDLYE